MVVIGTGCDFEAMFLGGDVDVVVPIVVLADGAVGMFGIGSWEDLDREIGTSWLCF